jgi:uncharacterized membrane protein YcaP (DUF421 family)
MDIVLRAIFLYVFIVLVLRVLGRRELSSISPGDLVLLMVLGDTIQQGMTQDDYSLTGAVIAVTTLCAMQFAGSYLSFRWPRARRVLEGDPIVIIEDGKLQSIASFDEVQWGIIERNGCMSFIKKSG